MPELWENPFANALLKIERANKHIGDIEKRLHASSDRYGPSLHIDLKAGEQFLYYGLTDSTLRSDIALIVGDAVHNLRCALDIAWCETVRVLGSKSESSHRKFPIDPKGNREKLKSTITKSAEIPESSPIVPFMLDQVKCYHGGDPDLLTLHELDINDKHRVLIPMLTVTGIDGVELQNEDGSIDRFDILLIRPNYYRRTVPIGAKFKNHGQVRFQVTFREGTYLQNIDVISTLERFFRKTRKIVRMMQSMAR